MKNISEVEFKEYAEFPLEPMNELVAMICDQFKEMWGAQSFQQWFSRILVFNVDGLLFKGTVFIGVNGLDLFDVYLCNGDHEIVFEMNDLHSNDLFDKIDEKVVKGCGR